MREILNVCKDHDWQMIPTQRVFHIATEKAKVHFQCLWIAEISFQYLDSSFEKGDIDPKVLDTLVAQKGPSLGS